MTAPSRALLAIVLPLVGALVPADSLVAQTPELDELRTGTHKKVLNKLTAFARRATSSKLPSMARVAWRHVVEHYDPDHKPARRALGFALSDGAWQRETAEKDLDKDEANYRKRQGIEKAWGQTCEQVAELHRELARALRDGGFAEKAQEEFRRVLAFAPDDEEGHLAIGHEAYEGFFGTAEDIAFAQRLRTLRETAREIAKKTYEIEPVPPEEMPAELAATGLTFYGARSERFVHWFVDSQEAAQRSVLWAERGYELLGEILGEDARFRRPQAVAWFAVVRSEAQRKIVYEKSPSTMGRFNLSQAMMFAGTTFGTTDGRRAGLYDLHEREDADHAVAHVTKLQFLGGRNDGLGEGLVHAMTWLLCGTTLTRYADLPKTVSGDAKPLGSNPAEWRKRLDQDISKGEDWPLHQLPRERADNFRDGARIKGWSFLVFMLARFPDRWYDLLDGMSAVELRIPEDVEAVFQEELGMSTQEVNDLWRAWAAPGSKLGVASGW